MSESVNGETGDPYGSESREEQCELGEQNSKTSHSIFPRKQKKSPNKSPVREFGTGDSGCFQRFERLWLGKRGILSQSMHDRGQIREIRKQRVGAVCGELLNAKAAGGNGHSIGAEGPRARDVVRRVSDDKDGIWFEGSLVHLNCPLESKWAEVITVMMVICECAQFEQMFHTIVLQF